MYSLLVVVLHITPVLVADEEVDKSCLWQEPVLRTCTDSTTCWKNPLYGCCRHAPTCSIVTMMMSHDCIFIVAVTLLLCCNYVVVELLCHQHNLQTPLSPSKVLAQPFGAIWCL